MAIKDPGINPGVGEPDVMRMDIKDIKINGHSIPVVDKNGFNITKNKLWSKNTGRTTSGKMVGDITAVKYSLVFSWSSLNGDQVSDLEIAVGTDAFFPVKFPKEGTMAVLTKTFYAADMTYDTKFVKDGVTYYSDVKLELIEQ